MSMLNPVLPWLFGALGVALLVLIALDLPRWGRRAGRIATRGGAGVLLTVCVLLTAFLALNDEYVFYSGWSDLFADDDTGAAVSHDGATAPAALDQPDGPGIQPFAGPSSYDLPDPGKRLQTFHVLDATSGTSMLVLAYLPVGYDPASPRRYPVIVALHGFPAVPQQITKRNILPSVDQATAAHQLASSIVLAPQIAEPETFDTECINGNPGQPQTDTWLSDELPSWTTAHLRARTDRQSWATLGFSYGGWCASVLTMRHPGVFGAGISLLGYFAPEFPGGYRPLTEPQRRSYDLAHIAATAPPPVALWVFTSKEDTSVWESAKRFLGAVRPPLSVTSVVVPHGGHRAQVFEPYLVPSLQWLGSTLPGFHP